MYKWKEEIPKEKNSYQYLTREIALDFSTDWCKSAWVSLFPEVKKETKIDIRNKFIEKDYGTFAWVF